MGVWMSWSTRRCCLSSEVSPGGAEKRAGHVSQTRNHNDGNTVSGRAEGAGIRGKGDVSLVLSAPKSLPYAVFMQILQALVSLLKAPTPTRYSRHSCLHTCSSDGRILHQLDATKVCTTPVLLIPSHTQSHLPNTRNFNLTTPDRLLSVSFAAQQGHHRARQAASASLFACVE